MSARNAGILLAVLLLAPSADAGWFGDPYKKKLPKAIKIAEIKRQDTARLSKPSKVLSSIDRKLEDPFWGGARQFSKPNELRVSHQNGY